MTHVNLWVINLKQSTLYGKCPKILYTEVSDKMAHANSVDPDQTPPSEAV